jgi:glyoxylase-like metal-dependent hydrolase (beta-lactamase superfamily II)
MSLPPGVTVFERGWLSSNNILFDDGESAALVDSGYWSHAEQTLALVGRVLQGRPLGRLLNTHLHSDHCGGNAALQARHPGLQTFIPPGLAAVVRDWDPVSLSYAPTGQHCPRFAFQGVLEPGSAVVLAGRPWEIHAAPGHDPHSVVLFERHSRTLVSADALWRNGFGVVFQELEGEGAFDEVAATLDLIEALGPSVVIPGHGPVFSEVGEALAAARRRLDGFRQDPRKHASHAAKVLLKFRLLEWQRVATAELSEWLRGTPYFSLVHARYFGHLEFGKWLDQLLDDLERGGALAREPGFVVNR